jgi:hypothetical protein
MSNELKYQDMVNDFISGTHYGVFIDDTGSPGGCSYKLLPKDRKTWVAVVIPPSQITETYIRFSSLLSDLKKRFGITEFHFTDIFGGSREFRKINWENRLGIINTIARAFENYGYPIINQSLEPSQLPEWKKKLNLPDKLSIFDFNRLEDTALFILFVKLRVHIRKQQGDEKGAAHVFVDEGWKKNGIGIISDEIFGPEFDQNKVCFGSSKNIVLLQLADFAAYVLNRIQIANSKENVTKKELHFLQVVEPMVHLYSDIALKKRIIHTKTRKILSGNLTDFHQINSHFLDMRENAKIRFHQ